MVGCESQGGKLSSSHNYQEGIKLCQLFLFGAVREMLLQIWKIQEEESFITKLPTAETWQKSKTNLTLWSQTKDQIDEHWKKFFLSVHNEYCTFERPYLKWCYFENKEVKNWNSFQEFPPNCCIHLFEAYIHTHTHTTLILTDKVKIHIHHLML